MINLIIFDWKRTLYDPDRGILIRGAEDVLNYLVSKNLKLILVGKGGEDMQREVDKLDVRNFFTDIVFAEGEKDPNVFAKYLTKIPKNTLFIGDRVRSELEIGNKLGATTIWVRAGKFADELPEIKEQEPDYTVKSLTDCLNFLKSNLLS